MKRFLFLILFLAPVLVMSGEETSDRGSYRFEPCDTWTMSGGNWQCMFLGQRIEVVTVDETNRLVQIIAAQDKKISDLEERLAKLER